MTVMTNSDYVLEYKYIYMPYCLATVTKGQTLPLILFSVVILLTAKEAFYYGDSYFLLMF